MEDILDIQATKKQSEPFINHCIEIFNKSSREEIIQYRINITRAIEDHKKWLERNKRDIESGYIDKIFKNEPMPWRENFKDHRDANKRMYEHQLHDYEILLNYIDSLIK